MSQRSHLAGAKRLTTKWGSSPIGRSCSRPSACGGLICGSRVPPHPPSAAIYRRFAAPMAAPVSSHSARNEILAEGAPPTWGGAALGKGVSMRPTPRGKYPPVRPPPLPGAVEGGGTPGGVRRVPSPAWGQRNRSRGVQGGVPPRAGGCSGVGGPPGRWAAGGAVADVSGTAAQICPV